MKKLVASAFAGLTAVLGVAGCATPRAALGTKQSTCFPALAVADVAVGHQGRFAGVRRVSLSEGETVPFLLGTPTTPRPPTLVPPTTAPGATSAGPRRAVCLVAYKGRFDPFRIPLLRGPNRTGPYAVVVVGLRTRAARAVYLTDHLPKAFSHL